MHVRKVVRVGNSLHISIPEPIVRAEGIEKGDNLFIYYDEGVMTIDIGETADINHKNKNYQKKKPVTKGAK